MKYICCEVFNTSVIGTVLKISVFCIPTIIPWLHIHNRLLVPPSSVNSCSWSSGAGSNVCFVWVEIYYFTTEVLLGTVKYFSLLQHVIWNRFLNFTNCMHRYAICACLLIRLDYPTTTTVSNEKVHNTGTSIV